MGAQLLVAVVAAAAAAAVVVVVVVVGGGGGQWLWLWCLCSPCIISRSVNPRAFRLHLEAASCTNARFFIAQLGSSLIRFLGYNLAAAVLSSRNQAAK